MSVQDLLEDETEEDPEQLTVREDPTNSVELSPATESRVVLEQANVELLDAVSKKLCFGEIGNILVLGGAGMSTAAGLPDFRSEG